MERIGGGPPVESARRIGEKYRLNRVVVMWTDDERERFGFASWGKDRAECKSAKRLANKLYAVTSRHLTEERNART